MSEDNKQFTLGILVLIVILAIFYGFTQLNKPQIKSVSTGNSDSTKQTNSSTDSPKYSVDDSNQPFKTLDYKTAVSELNTSSEGQMFYIGCRNCGYCAQLEKIMDEFLQKYSDKNKKRDLIYRIEAGYNCVPEESSDQHADYVKIYQFLVDNKIAEENEHKGFGTPIFVFVKNGKIVDDLNKYGRSVDAITKMFKQNNYRGF